MKPFPVFVLVWLAVANFAAAEKLVPPASQRFAKSGAKETPDFQRHITPLLGRLGCNSGQCHGSFQGRGGLRFSLFGFDFAMDHAGLTGEATSEEGSRLNRKKPGRSLILRKPTMQIDHEGGKRFAPGSWEYHLLQRWIQTGAKGTNRPQRLRRLHVQPREIVFSSDRQPVQLRVIAEWQSGLREDVTCLCRFRTNDDAVATVNRNGRISPVGKGDTHVVAFYDNGVMAVSVMRPVGRRLAKPGVTYDNPIDKFVAEKLNKLGIEPAKLCTDAEFLRRVSIDVAGTLPTPLEVRSFLADRRPDKRLRKIKALLDRPAYAGWWATKLCDFTGCSPAAVSGVTEVGQAVAAQWYNWIFRRVQQNMPYDKLVEGIVLSQGRQAGQSYADYSAEMSSYVRRQSPQDFARRPTMPHYWTRQSVKDDKDKALSFAHSFLGIQLQCAQCHKHPFDQWTQRDFADFTAFFKSIGVRGGQVGFPAFAAARAGAVIRWPALFVDSDAEAEQVTLLRSRAVKLGGGKDPRRPIMKWMRDKSNPWFARSFVNRVWATYFHIGIVDPPDALTPANPPSNPALLNWLTREFVRHKFDMKWLHRQITSSQTYQRSWRPTANNRNDRRNFSRAIPRRIPAEVVYDAVKQVTAASTKQSVVRTNLRRRAAGYLSMRLAGTYAMKVFGKPDRSVNCDCERVNAPTLLQTVFMQNDPLIRMRLAESGYLEEIAALKKSGKSMAPAKITVEIWLRALGRLPRQAELKRALRHHQEVTDLREWASDLLWALMNTKEFILQH